MGAQWVWVNHEMNNCLLICGQINSHKKSPNRNFWGQMASAFSPAPRNTTVQVVVCQRAAVQFMLHFLVQWFYCRSTGPRTHLETQGDLPLWSGHFGQLTQSNDWPWRAVQTDVGKAVRIICNDCPFHCPVYSLTPSRLQFPESLVTHFSRKCK